MASYKASPRKVFNRGPAPPGIDPNQAAALEATQARRPCDRRLQPNLIRTNSLKLSNELGYDPTVVTKGTRVSLARLSRQALPGSLEEAELLAARALSDSSQSKRRFDALREAAYRVFTFKGQIESNRYQLDHKRQDIQLLLQQLEHRGRQRSRTRPLPAEELQRKQHELQGHVANLQRKEEELLQIHQLALKWLRHWIRYSVPLQTAEEVECSAEVGMARDRLGQGP